MKCPNPDCEYENRDMCYMCGYRDCQTDMENEPSIADFSQACKHEEHTWDCEECHLKLLNKSKEK